MNSPIEIMLFINYSLIKKEYLVLFIFFILALVLTLLIIGASYNLAVQNPELQKSFTRLWKEAWSSNIL